MKTSKNRFRFFWLVLAVVTLPLACGDSDDTPLGSEFIGDILGSTPGHAFEDSLDIPAGDTSYVFYSMIDQQGFLRVGIDRGYEQASIVRANFSSAGNDTLRTVDRATLRLTIMQGSGLVDDILAKFYELAQPYEEGDSLETLDTTFVITDPGNNDAEVRQLSFGTLAYELPAALVQSWIRGVTPNNGIAMVYAGVLEELGGIFSSEGLEPPSLQVFFTDLSNTLYPVTNDGIFTRPLTTTDNLVISDGFVRRVWLPLDLSAVDDSASINEANLVLKVVPGSVFGISQSVELYVPNSSDPSDSEFLRGQGVTRTTIADSTDLVLPVTNVLLDILSGRLENNGFALRYLSENTEVRQAEFYTTANVALRPKIYVIYSTPAEFEE